MVGMADIRDAKNIVIKNGRWENILTGADVVPFGCPIANSDPTLAGVVLYPYIYHTNTSPVTVVSEIMAGGFVGGVNTLMRLTRNGVPNQVIIFPPSLNAGTMSLETVKEHLFFTNGVDAPFVYDGPTTFSTGTNTTYEWGIREGPPITSITYDTSVIELLSTFDVTSGNQVITLHGGTSIPSGTGYVNKTIWLSTISGQNAEDTAPGNRFTITGQTAGGAGVGTLTISPAPTFNGTAMTSQINYGNITWTTGAPTLACSYYDSLRAHSGSIGPVFTPPDYAKYNVNLVINFIGDTTGANSRCDQVLIWSTPVFTNGGNLQILNYKPNASGALQYIDSRTDDLSLGTYLGNFIAPLNNGQPLYFSSIAYWNGVMWGLAPRGPSSLATAAVTAHGSGYSDGTISVVVDPPSIGGVQAVIIPVIKAGAVIGAQLINPGQGYVTVPNVTITDSGGGSGASIVVTLANNFDLSLLFYSNPDDPSVLGRGEESWDPRNFLRIPAKDGAGLGLAVVGDSLIIQTERYLYTVAGSTPSNYILTKLSSKGIAIGQYHLTEYIGDSTDTSSAMVFLGQDRVVWAQAPGSGSINLSMPIQNVIDGVLRGSDLQKKYPFCRVNYVTIGGESYLVVLLK